MDMLSQEEIDALLGGSSTEEDVDNMESTEFDENLLSAEDSLSDDQKDALGEIGNISMGTAATTLFTLLNQKVTITTPKVRAISWRDLSREYVKPCVGIKVEYSEGLFGANVLVLQEQDVKIIADLMMGGDGTNIQGELTDIHLSAIAEAMNQMVGSSSTSLSTMLNSKIDIKPPQAFQLNFDDDDFFKQIGLGLDSMVCISFRMEIGTLIDSEIMQIFSVNFAKTLVNGLLGDGGNNLPTNNTPTSTEVQQPPNQSQQSMYQQQPMYQEQQPIYQGQQPIYQQQPMHQGQQSMYQQQPIYQGQQPIYQQQPIHQTQTPNINAQPVQFQNFDPLPLMQQKENIEIIMDVPLEVTVELGRTHKSIKEILEFKQGTIIDLDTLAGEPIDILVNGKFVAKGEVVVIDENFAIRVSDIIGVENRI